MGPLSSEQVAFVQGQRVGLLATADAHGIPHAMPICFVLQEGVMYTPVDQKPKRSLELKRLRNIRDNPQVALLFHRYDEDWSQLGWVLIYGVGALVEGEDERQRAIALLRQKYPQYQSMAFDQSPIIGVQVHRARSWGRLEN